MRPLLTLAVILIAGCGAPPAEPTKPPEPARPAPSPRPTPRTVPTVKAVEPTPAQAEVKEPSTFKSDWLAAQDLLDARADRRLKEADAAKKLLSRAELLDAEPLLRAFERSPERMTSAGAAKLNRLGFGESVRYFSSQAARADKLFLNMAKAAWAPGFGAERLAALAERWLQADDRYRQSAARAVIDRAPANDLPTTTRDAILDLGLRDWLAR